MPATAKEMLWHHVWYEFWMLDETFQALEAGVQHPILANTLIESFSMHARNLIEFFEKDVSEHYATARFFADGTYASLSKSIVRKELRKKLHTQLLHLTWERTNEDSEKLRRRGSAPARQDLAP
jgi:hypothetical protein